MLRVNNLTRIYYPNTPREIRARDGVNFSIAEGEFVAILGKSGSGKSTLMSLLGGLDTPTAGEVIFDGDSIYKGKRLASRLARFRAKKLGFVFQTFNLIPSLTALANVELAAAIVGGGLVSAKSGGQVLASVGLSERADNKAVELSGGEQQRVAIARALVKNPEVLLADEPTGNLDSETATQIIDLFAKLNRDKKLTVIVVTHDEDIAGRAGRVITLRDGKVITDEKQ